MFRIPMSPGKKFLFRGSALACAALLLLLHNGLAVGETEGADLAAGFHQMYNLDFSAAHKTFQDWQAQHPADPLGAASDAAAYLFAEFERLHVLDLALFTSDKAMQNHDKLLPDSAIKASFEAELAKADSMAAQALAQSSNDRNALFAKVLIDGLRGNYAALVENNKRAALSFLKASRSTAETLVAVDPACYDAYLAIGIENYLLGLRSAPARFMLRLSGAQTSKDKGISSLTVTAQKGTYLKPYARLLLVIAALRDGDRNTAKKLLGDLAREFPGNRLYQIEAGRLKS